MKFFQFAQFITVALTLLSSALFAQESGDGVNGKKKIGKTFRIASWSDWKGDDLFISTSKKGIHGNMQEVEILDMSYSKGYPYSASEALVFYKKTGDSETPYEPVVKVRIPASYSKPLVFIVQDEEKINHVVYDLDDKQFPFGTYKIVNFTKTNLLFNFGEKRFLVKPKSSQNINFQLKRKTKAVHCMVGYKSKNGETKVVYSAMMMNRKNKRMLMFFYPGKDEVGRPSIRCRSLVDFASSKKKSS